MTLLFFILMRNLNSSKLTLFIGNKVKLKKEFANGYITLPVGSLGEVIDLSIESFPDLGLFNIKVLSFKFGKYHFSVGEDIIRGYVEKI